MVALSDTASPRQRHLSEEGNERTVTCPPEGRGHRKGKDPGAGACLCSLKEQHGVARGYTESEEARGHRPDPRGQRVKAKVPFKPCVSLAFIWSEIGSLWKALNDE